MWRSCHFLYSWERGMVWNQPSPFFLTFFVCVPLLAPVCQTALIGCQSTQGGYNFDLKVKTTWQQRT